MRRFAALCLMCLMLAQPALSRVEAPSEETQSILLREALSLCALTDACADDPEYAKLYQSSGVQEEMGKIGLQDWSVPQKARLYIIREKLFDIYLSASSVDENALSAPVRKKLRDAIPSSLSGLINTEQSGFPGASSALRCGKVFLADQTDMPEWSLLYLSFDGGYDALCSFVRTEDGIVSAYLSVVRKDGMDRLLRQLKRAFIQEKDLFESFDINLDRADSY